jgi:preprotein translocase subunit SecG
MITLFIILIILACIILSLIVLVQNPKGGGLAGNVAGFSNQFMGVKQTTDVLEKGTWIFAAVIAILCITSTMFIKGGGSADELQNLKTTRPATSAPATTPPANNAAPFQNNAQQPQTTTPDTSK